MSNKYIPQLPQITSPLLSGDTIYDDGVTTYKMSLETLRNFFNNINNSNVINLTYSELVNNITGSTLNPGYFYKITNFKTCYDIPDYYMNGDYKTNGNVQYYSGSTIEPIIVLATSVNTIDENAYQPSHPNDKIKYDYRWSNTEITSSPTYGRITERIDEFNNRTDYDHRNIKFIRYQSYDQGYQLSGIIQSYDCTTGIIIGSGTTFLSDVNVGDVLFIDDIPNQKGVKVISATTDTTLTVVVDSGYTSTVFSNQSYVIYRANAVEEYFVYKEVYVGQHKQNDYDIFLTFRLDGGGTMNNYIGNYSNLYLNKFNSNGFLLSNNVFFSYQSTYDNKIGDGSYCNTIRWYFYENKIGYSFCYNKTKYSSFNSNNIENGFQNNIINHGFFNNSIGYGFQNNYINPSFGENNIGYYFQNNMIYSNSYFGGNIIGQEFYSNMIYSIFYDNVIDIYFHDNNIYLDFGENKISQKFYNNEIHSYFTQNNTDLYFYENIIGNSGNTFYYNNNKIDQYFKSNIINGDFTNNIIDYGMTANQFFGSTSSNEIGYITINNDFLGDVYNNKWSRWFSSNSVGGNFINNVIGDSFQSNVINQNFQSNIIPNSNNDNGDYVFKNQYNNSSVLCEDTTVNVYKNRSGNHRLSYYDEMDVLTTDSLTGDTLYSFTIQSSDFTNGYGFGNNNDNTAIGTNGIDGFSVNNSENPLYGGFYGQNLIGESLLSGLTTVYNNLGLDLNNSRGYVCQVQWGDGSSINKGLVKFGAVVSNGGYFDIQTIDPKDRSWKTTNNIGGTSLTGTFRFPATFSFYLPLINKVGWC